MGKIRIALNRGLLVLKKYSPEILLATGLTGCVASTVYACKNTLKLPEVIEKHAEECAVIAYEKPDDKKAMFVQHVKTAGKIAKIYAGPAVVGALSVSAILGSHNIMKSRNLALAAAYKALDEHFNEYRGIVREKYGEEEEIKIYSGETVVKSVDPETGETVEVTKYSKYAKFFDEASKYWEKDALYNRAFLESVQSKMNDLFDARGHVFLNEVYDALDIPRTPEGALVGWMKGYGDDYIDIGLTNGSEAGRRFINGDERNILLDFNVDGEIYGLLGSRSRSEAIVNYK